MRRISETASCAASMADARTTLEPGLVEMNPALGAGRPGAGRIIGMKIGLCARQIAYSEWLRRRTHSTTTEKINTVGAIGQAIVYSVLAAHNAQIAK